MSMPGKYDNELAETLHNLTLDGTCEGFGDVEMFGKYVSMVEDFEDEDYLVIEDGQGFVTIEGPFAPIEIDGAVGGGYFCPVRRRFDEMCAEWVAFMDDGEDGE